MLDHIQKLKGVIVLGKIEQKAIAGKGGCGVRTTDGVWYPVVDGDGNGATIDDAHYWLNHDTRFDRWCCDSCPWNL